MTRHPAAPEVRESQFHTGGYIAVYVIAEHVPRQVADTHLATESFSLLPALLFVLQTGMRLQPRLTAVFALLVGAGWISTIAILSNTVGFSV